MTQQQTVVSSVVEITPTEGNIPTCSCCPLPAKYIWPATSDEPEPFCEECLNKAIARLCIALGS